MLKYLDKKQLIEVRLVSPHSSRVPPVTAGKLRQLVSPHSSRVPPVTAGTLRWQELETVRYIISSQEHGERAQASPLFVNSSVSQLLIQFRTSCLGNDASHSGLSRHYQSLRTVFHRHTHRPTQCGQSLIETLFLCYSRLYPLAIKANGHSGVRLD